MQITAAKMEPSFTRLHSQLLRFLRGMKNVQLKKKQGLPSFLASLSFPCTEPDIQLYSHPSYSAMSFKLYGFSQHLPKVLLRRPSKANRLLNSM